MSQALKFTLAGALAAAIVAGLFVAMYRRRRAADPGLIKHPERLDEMLDSTDDA